MDSAFLVIIVLVTLALAFDFTNGFHDAANQVATVIASRALAPFAALALAAIANFVGAYFLGTAVAETIGKGIVDPRIFAGVEAGGGAVISAALGAAIIWNLITWKFGMPSSSSHALIGGLLGAFLAGWGMSPIHWSKIAEILAVMALSPFVGLTATYLFTKLTLTFSWWSVMRMNKIFRRLQIISLVTQGLAHGTNDAQKTMGVITFSLVLLGWYRPVAGEALLVPSWVIVTCAAAIALGTFSGGWRIIKTLGAGLYKIRPIHGFASQTASTLIIYGTSLFGFPISTTQVISSSVMGAGAAFRPKMVRWQVAKNMALAWLVTIPVSGALAWIGYRAINIFF